MHSGTLLLALLSVLCFGDEKTPHPPHTHTLHSIPPAFMSPTTLGSHWVVLVSTGPGLRDADHLPLPYLMLDEG